MRPIHIRFHAFIILGAVLVLTAVPTRSARAQAQENLMFAADENIRAELIARINAETERLDVAVWYLTERRVTDAIIAKHKSGTVTVRVIGDRVSIFENDPNTTREFEHLATNGVPIRVRYNPTWFPEIIHWKATIFVSQDMVEFGSANYTVFELAPWSDTNYQDESALFTKDPSLVNAFKTQFDKYWADTTYFKDFNEAYRLERKTEFPVQLVIDRTRLEGDYPLPPEMVWGQGPDFNNKLTSEINKETDTIDIMIFRLSNANIASALVAKHQAGVPVRAIIEPAEYNRDTFPEYELTRARIDSMWAAGIPIKKRVHMGLMHMKTLITSSVATIASSNFTNNWQRDHNYFLPSATKPGLHQEVRDKFNEMWNDPAAFGSFTPSPPKAAVLSSPANGSTGVSQTPQLVWKRATWAVAYDVLVGTSTTNMQKVADVPAVLTESPPANYSWTPSSPLPAGTTLFWRVVSRTNAGLTNPSATWSFTTTGTGGGGGGGTTQSPFSGSPIALPGTVQAENFDNGGPSVAYVDTSAVNSGGAFRLNEGVDIEGTADSGGGFNVGWMSAGEWMEYTVNVAAAGTYTLQARVAASGAGGTFHVEFGGVNKTGAMTIPNTGGWQNWITISKSVTLSAGTQVMRVALDTNGASGVFGNMNWIKVETAGEPDPPPPPPPPGGSTPFSGTPVALPGTVQAENFDNGGSGVAYVDLSAGNTGGKYRLAENVDIESTGDGGPGFDVGWMSAGEWLNYTVNVGTDGDYTLEVRVAVNGAGGTFHVEFGGINKTGPMTIPNTGGWQTWTTISKPVTLTAGTQVMRVVLDSNGSGGLFGNMNWIKLSSPSAPPPPPPPGGSTPFSGTPIALPATVQLENFDNGGAGVAYADNDPTNNGGAFRTDTAVDVESTADSGGGFNLGWVGAGEWLKYTVTVPTDGTYTLQVRVASPSGGGTFHVEFGGVNKTGAMAIPNTGGWQNWTTLSKSVSLSAGTQVIRLVIDANAGDGLFGNMNWIRVQ
jgi:hypothetical protein